MPHLSDLQAASTLSATDLMYKTDAVGIVGKKISAQDAATSFFALAGVSAIISTDIATHDASATAHTAVAHNWAAVQTFSVGAIVGIAGTPADLLLHSNNTTAPWYLHPYSATFNGTRDDIFNLSINFWGTTDPTRGSASFQIETNYNDGVDISNEFIFSSIAPNGAFPIRLLQMNENYDDGTGTIFTRGQVLMYSSNPAAAGPFITLSEAGQFKLDQGAYILGSNNVQFVKSLNASSVETTLLYLDTSNIAQIAPTTGAAFGSSVNIKNGVLHAGVAGGLNNIEIDSGSTLGTYKWAFYLGGSNELYLWTGSIWGATFTTAGYMGINNYGPTTYLDIAGDKMRLRTAKTPASAAAAGAQGDICWDADSIYICTATNAWKKAAIATW